MRTVRLMLTIVVLVAIATPLFLTNANAAEASIAKTRPFQLEPSSQEDALPIDFRLEAATLTARERLVDSSLVQVTFPSPVESGHPPNDIVHAEFYPASQTKETSKSSAVIFLHYLDGNLVLPRIFCRMFASKGVAALLVKMPYYHERREGTERRMLSPDLTQTTASVRQAVLDVRVAHAYLASRPEIDSERIGIAGISLGGIVGSLAFELEPRLERGCFLLAGADIPSMLWESELTSKMRGQWEADGLSKADLAKAFAPVDPASYPGRRGDRDVLLLSGRGDDTVPEACTQALVRALDDPEIIWFEGGHKPGPSEVAEAMLHVFDFFNRRERSLGDAGHSTQSP